MPNIRQYTRIITLRHVGQSSAHQEFETKEVQMLIDLDYVTAISGTDDESVSDIYIMSGEIFTVKAEAQSLFTDLLSTIVEE